MSRDCRFRPAATVVLLVGIFLNRPCIAARVKPLWWGGGRASPPPPEERGDAPADRPITRIAFGSCRNESAPQPIWDAVLQFDPDVFIWLGDNIYGDIKQPPRIWGPECNTGPCARVPRFLMTSPEEMAAKYQLGKSHPVYRKLLNRTKVIGTWDDHDYGLNDAGLELPNKQLHQQLALDFLDEPADSLRRSQDGIYASYTYGPQGKRVKVFLLDTRYSRDPLSSDGTLLGEEQWRWLEEEVRASDAQVNIFGSSIQVLGNISAMVQPLFAVEGWARFPSERQKLFRILADSELNGTLFISGDVHFGEFNRFDCSGLQYPLFEITSSGLTQGVLKAFRWPVPIALGIGAWMMPTTMRVYGRGCATPSCTWGLPNFGTIEVDWTVTPPSVHLGVRAEDGRKVLGQDLTLRQLSVGALAAELDRRKGVGRHCAMEVELPWLLRHQLAFAFFAFMLTLLCLPCLCCCGAAVAVVGLRQKLKTKPD